MVRFNARANPIPSRTTHNTLLEVLWTVMPVVILVVIAVPSFKLLFLQLNMPPADVTMKATGKQWYWTYSYPDHGKFEFNSLMLREDKRAQARPAAPARGRQRDGGAGQQDRARAGDRRRRDPRLRGAVVRHQDRRHPRPPQRDLVQGDARRRLLRPVLGTVRQGSRLHADRGAGGERAGIRRLARRGEEEVRERRHGARRPTWRRRNRPRLARRATASRQARTTGSKD